jgi:hypothetical protein
VAVEGSVNGDASAIVQNGAEHEVAAEHETSSNGTSTPATHEERQPAPVESATDSE